MAGGDALGHPRAAGGKHDVDGVGVDAAAANTLKRRLVLLGGEKLRHGEHCVPVTEVAQKLFAGIVTHDGGGLKPVKYHADAVLRHTGVERNIVAAGVYDRKKGADHLRRFFHKHRNGFVVKPLRYEAAAAPAGKLRKGSKAYRLALVCKRRLFGEPLFGGLKILQYIFHSQSGATKGVVSTSGYRLWS